MDEKKIDIWDTLAERIESIKKFIPFYLIQF